VSTAEQHRKGGLHRTTSPPASKFAHPSVYVHSKAVENGCIVSKYKDLMVSGVKEGWKEGTQLQTEDS
jgi:hypothetical protein